MKKINKKKGFFKNNYFKGWNYLKESKNFIYTIVVIFFIFVLLGFFVPVPNAIAEQILNFINELIEKTKGMSQLELINFIFLNNFQSSFFGIIFGIILGVLPIIIAISNGYLLGFVASVSVENDGLSILWRLLPHGIFELPAVFISLGMGLKIGMFIFQKKKLKSLSDYFFNSLRVFLLVVVPLLIIAAFIEGTLIFL